MKKPTILKIAALSAFMIAVMMSGYVTKESKALSYLSTDPKACINCHVMNTQYATWQHSSHNKVTCIECHLPTDSFVDKYIAKAHDGWNHSVAFTLDTYDNAIQISDHAAARVQKNCISCHTNLVGTLATNNLKNHVDEHSNIATGRKCWECHTNVPHGEVRGLTTTSDNLGVKEVK